MAQKALGRGSYSAFRLGDIVHLTATGQTPNFNDKVEIEQLPFLILPPMFALYFEHPDIVFPAVRPFTCTRDIHFYPRNANTLTIQDADGFHSVSITQVPLPDPQIAVAPLSGDDSYCVFSGFGINPLQVAPCDAKLPPGYERVYGPAGLGDCRRYAEEHRGRA
jgi:hypothetical protein